MKLAEMIDRVLARYRIAAEDEAPRVPSPQSKNAPREMDLDVSTREEFIKYQQMFPGTERTVRDVLEAREEKNRRRRRSILPREELSRRRSRRRPRPSRDRDA